MIVIVTQHNDNYYYPAVCTDERGAGSQDFPNTAADASLLLEYMYTLYYSFLIMYLLFLRYIYIYIYIHIKATYTYDYT